MASCAFDTSFNNDFDICVAVEAPAPGTVGGHGAGAPVKRRITWFPLAGDGFISVIGRGDLQVARQVVPEPLPVWFSLQAQLATEARLGGAASVRARARGIADVDCALAGAAAWHIEATAAVAADAAMSGEMSTVVEAAAEATGEAAMSGEMSIRQPRARGMQWVEAGLAGECMMAATAEGNCEVDDDETLIAILIALAE